MSEPSITPDGICVCTCGWCSSGNHCGSDKCRIHHDALPPMFLDARDVSKPWRGRQLVVPWPGHNIPLVLSIYVQTKMDTEKAIDIIQGYNVNWAALGSTPPELTRRYAEALKMASDVADELTKKFKGKPWE